MRFSAKFVKETFRVFNMKKMVGITMVTPPKRRDINTKQLQKTKIPQEKRRVNRSEMITLFPSVSTNKHIFYLHGGGFSLEASPFHKNIQTYFVNEFGLKVSYFNYPLAPENTVSITLDETFQAYKEIVMLYPDDHFYLFGDSAGGGLALSLAQQLRDQNVLHRPQKIVLASPWLDLTLSNPDIEKIQGNDVLLERELLAKAAKNYAGDFSLKDPRVSHLYGNLDDLKEIFTVVGTDDILFPDVLRLEKRIEKTEGTKLHLEVVEGMMHDFLVYPLKESKSYLKQIGDFYQK